MRNKHWRILRSAPFLVYVQYSDFRFQFVSLILSELASRRTYYMRMQPPAGSVSDGQVTVGEVIRYHGQFCLQRFCFPLPFQVPIITLLCSLLYFLFGQHAYCAKIFNMGMQSFFFCFDVIIAPWRQIGLEMDILSISNTSSLY